MKTALITGANKGIGLEAAKQLLQEGFYLYIGSRDLQNGRQAVEGLKSEGLDKVEAVQLDVTDDESVKTARAEIGKQTEVLDVLINNAGISGGGTRTALGLEPERFKAVLDTNVIGVARVTDAFIDLLQKSDGPRIVNVSSSVGSLTLQSDPAWFAYNYSKFGIYGTSKAALNMYTVQVAYELRDTPFKVNAVCPGYTKTDFTSHEGTGTVEDAAARVVKYALIGNDGPTGKFFSEETNPETGEIPW